MKRKSSSSVLSFDMFRKREDDDFTKGSEYDWICPPERIQGIRQFGTTKNNKMLDKIINKKKETILPSEAIIIKKSPEYSKNRKAESFLIELYLPNDVLSKEEDIFENIEQRKTSMIEDDASDYYDNIANSNNNVGNNENDNIDDSEHYNDLNYKKDIMINRFK